jgi:hypothetical protein
MIESGRWVAVGRAAELCDMSTASLQRMLTAGRGHELGLIYRKHGRYWSVLATADGGALQLRGLS